MPPESRTLEPAAELHQILVARFQKAGMSPRAANTWAHVAVEAIADALEERRTQADQAQ